MASSNDKLFKKLPFLAIKPKGWLKRQLLLQAEGLTSQIDEIWANESKKSAWLGGNGEAGMLGPIYLNGLVTLAYLLNDEKLINKSNKWIGRILASVNSNGFFGPKRNSDWLSRTIAINALITYYEATNDVQILPFIKNYFVYLHSQIDDNPLYLWESARAFEVLIPLKFLYDKTNDEFVIELIKKLNKNSVDWFNHFKKFKFKHPSKRYINKNIVKLVNKKELKRNNLKKNEDVKKLSKNIVKLKNSMLYIKKMMLTHGVNNAMAIKYPVLYNEFFPTEGLEDLSRRGLQTLLKYHGTAIGVFTSDEHLNGVNASQGVEVCTIVELMRSLQVLLEKTGDTYYADLLELIAYNALPASLTADCTANQPLQQVNQISAITAKRAFFNSNKTSNTYCISNSISCCNAIVNQAFPKLVESLCLKRDNELAFFAYAPCTIETEIGETKIKLVESTDYPFKNEVKIAVDTITGNPEVKFSFRVPQYSSVVISLNGQEIATGNKGIISVKHLISTNDEFILRFDTPLTITSNPDKSYSIRKGSLLMATKLKAKHKQTGKSPYEINEYKTLTQWRTSPDIKKKALTVIKVREREVPKKPYDETCPPIEVDYVARYVMNWEEYKNSAGAVPRKAKLSKELFIRTLVPYGCTKIRVAHHPQSRR